MPLTASTAKAAVGALLDVDIETNSTPSTNQVFQWLYDGAIEMMAVLPDGALAGFTDTKEYGSVKDLNIVVEDIELLRIVAVTKAGKLCDRLPLDVLKDIGKKAPYIYANDAAYAETGVGGQVLLSFLPDDVIADVILSYVHLPAPVNDWTASNSYAPPVSWTSFLARYAAIQAKIQDEEPEQAQLLFQMWANEVQQMASKLSTPEAS